MRRADRLEVRAEAVPGRRVGSVIRRVAAGGQGQDRDQANEHESREMEAHARDNGARASGFREPFHAGPVTLFASPMDELDEITVTRARRGDVRAFASLVRRYQRPVHAVIGRILAGVASAAEVDELAQEVFLRVFRALPGFEPQGPGRLTKWILTIASRLAIDELRRQRLPITAEVDTDQIESSGPRADADAASHRVAAEIARALASLTPEQRATFVLREFHDFDYDDIARALDVDLGTVKSRLSRARTALRAFLDDAGGARSGGCDA
jgi:RNA polymerase sigma-70 factor (ECF subfamily)